MKRMRVIGIGITITGLAIISLTVALSRPASAPTPSPASVAKTATFRGNILCLPHKNRTGPQTMECALGLAGDDDKLYGIKPANPSANPPYDTNQEVTVTGVLAAPKANEIYDVVGNITDATVTKQ